MPAPETSRASTVWVCGCGQAYRTATTPLGTRFWASAGAVAYSRRGLSASSPCIRCGAPLPATTR